MNALVKFSVLALLPVAVAAGWSSAVATSHMAIVTGAASSPGLAWTFPIVIEGAALSAGLLGYVRARAGEDARQEVGVLVVLAFLAMVINVAHAWGSWFGVLMAAAPPLILAAVLHLLLRNLEAVAKVKVQDAERLAAERLAAEQAEEAERVAAERRERARERRVERSSRRADQAVSTERPVSTAGAHRDRSVSTAAGEHDAVIIEELLAEHGDRLTGLLLAERLGCSPATGRRRLAAHRVRTAA